MTDASNVCGLCGAPNPSDAIVCVRCGALLAAYRAAPEPIAIAETPVAPEPLPTATPIVEEPPVSVASPVTPGAAAASIFGESKLTLRLPSVTSYELNSPSAPAAAPVVPAPNIIAPMPRPSRRVEAQYRPVEPFVEPSRPAAMQPTFRQVARKSESAAQSLYDAVASQPKQVGILSFVLFMVSMSMLTSGSVAAAALGAFVLIAALIGGGMALAVAARGFLDQQDRR